MGDHGNKIPKEKRHRSSISLLGLPEGKGKLNKTISKPDMDEQFTIAEARCGEFQQKLDYVKSLKRRKRIKRRSFTKLTDPPMESDLLPLISIQTKPKRKGIASRVKNPMVSDKHHHYSDPAMAEQHRMVGQLRGFAQSYQSELPVLDNPRPDSKTSKNRSNTNEDDSHSSRRTKTASANTNHDSNHFEQQHPFSSHNAKRRYPDNQQHRGAEKYMNTHGQTKSSNRKDRQLVELFNKEETSPHKIRNVNKQETEHTPRKFAGNAQNHSANTTYNVAVTRERDRPKSPQPNKQRNLGPFSNELGMINSAHRDNISSNNFSMEHINRKRSRGSRFQLQRYEMPTVSSQLKRAGVRYHQPYRSASNKIPFVATKSCAPSHNIGVNLQQVLNGLKIQQPIGGIPLSIANHMGLRHLPFVTKSEATTNIEPTLDVRDINVIKLGGRLVHLPSYKFMSYRRLLDLFKESDGMVSRFLKAVNRPHYFYTTMYSLSSTRGDCDGSTSKARGYNTETKQLLAEYATFYNEYERLEKRIADGDSSPHCLQRRDDLVNYLATREDYIRQMIKASNPASTNLKGSASTTYDRAVNKVKESQISVQ